MSGLDVSLRPAWTFDLAGPYLHDEMFTENRLIVRKFPPAEAGPRPPAYPRVADKILPCGSGTSPRVPWTPRRASRRHAAVPAAVDDGERLWCNSGGMAAAYSYDLRLLHFTDPGVHLAFPRHDPAGGRCHGPGLHQHRRGGRESRSGHG